MMRTALVALFIAACSKSESELTEAKPATETKVADDIARTVHDLTTKPPAPIAERDKQAAIAPTALVGTWRIKHSIYIKNGIPGVPEPPLMDGTWSFAPDGVYRKGGGNELQGSYVLTQNKLVISALGPALEYSVDKITPKELAVTQTIMPGMATTTILER